MAAIPPQTPQIPSGGVPLPGMRAGPPSSNQQAASHVANALAQNNQPGPPNAQPTAAAAPPASKSVVKVGQIIFHSIKLLALVALSPILLPLAGCMLLGWAISSSGNDLAEGVRETFKPLTDQLYGIAGGVFGLTGEDFEERWKHRHDEEETPPLPLTSPERGTINLETQAANPSAAARLPPPPLEAARQPPSVSVPVNQGAIQDAEEERRRKDEEAAEARREAASQSGSAVPPLPVNRPVPPPPRPARPSPLRPPPPPPDTQNK